MIYKDQNWGFNDYIKDGQPLNHRAFPVVAEGDVFISCNLTRKNSSTKTFDGISDLTFINCNLNGVDIKNTWVLDDNCSFVQNDYIEDEVANSEPQAPV
jgi:hypothetical protein